MSTRPTSDAAEKGWQGAGPQAGIGADREPPGTETQQRHPAETADLFGAYPRLSETQIGALRARGEQRSYQQGEALYRAGDRPGEFHVVLSGLVEIVEGFGWEHRRVAVHGPGRFLGELGTLTGAAAFLTATALEPGEVLAVPVDRLRELVARDQVLGDLILRALLTRRSMLLGLGTGIRIVGSRHSTATRRLREFAARNRLPHVWIDLEQDEGAEALLQALGVAPEETPVVLWRGGQVLRNPGIADLARLVGLPVLGSGETVCDLAIVGAGPAGLAAAVYGASEGLATVVLDKIATGGQAGTSSLIENYLGFPSGISGAELAERAVLQAEKFGARISVPVAATGLERGDACHVLRLDVGGTLLGRAVVIATGARYRRLDVPRIEEFEGTCVYYAATQAEAFLCRNDPVVVVGGGNSAGQAAVFLADNAARVRLVVREDRLSEKMSRYLADRVERHPNIDVLLGSEVRELVGDERLEEVGVEDNRTGERHSVEARDVFVFIGAEPHTGWLGGSVASDDRGYLLTGPNLRRDELPAGHRPYLLETSLPGVFAVGDVRFGSTKRIASAVGEGAMAVRLTHEHLAALGKGNR
ncbi:MAG: FAD-dependent oxidoreductase [Blastococcus sp.]